MALAAMATSQPRPTSSAVTPQGIVRRPLPTHALVLDCSGGSAHKRAADIVVEELHIHEVTFRRVDVLNSYCTFHPAIGRSFSGLWDWAQARGAVTTLDVLVTHLHMPAAWICYQPALGHVKTLLNTPDKDGTLVDRVVATSPLFLESIAAAVEHVNRTQPQRHVELDVYMVEPPTDQARYYYRPLAHLTAEQIKFVRLHALPPGAAELQDKFDGNEAAYWQARVGHALQVEHTVIVGPVYREADLMGPKHDVTIRLKAQNAAEVAFAQAHFTCHAQPDGVTYDVPIQAQDRVHLLMLGGVPTHDSVLQYARQALQQAPKLSGRNWLFIACGAPTSGIFEAVMQLIAQLPEVASLLVVPFTSQPAARILARADLTVTRSGGLTATEIIHLQSAGRPNKKIFIHSECKVPKQQSLTRFAHRLLAKEISAGSMPMPRDAIDGQQAVELAYDNYLCRGMPRWEAGNARYLRQEYQARCITPQTFGQVFGAVGDAPPHFVTYDEKQLREQLKRTNRKRSAAPSRAPLS